MNLLQRFMSDRSKLRARRMTGADVQQQRDIATAVKNAREMALLPYTKRVAGLRAPRGRGGEDREERGGVSRDVVERYENLAAAEAVSETPDAAAGADTPTEG